MFKKIFFVCLFPVFSQKPSPFYCIEKSWYVFVCFFFLSLELRVSLGGCGWMHLKCSLTPHRMSTGIYYFVADQIVRVLYQYHRLTFDFIFYETSTCTIFENATGSMYVHRLLLSFIFSTLLPWLMSCHIQFHCNIYILFGSHFLEMHMAAELKLNMSRVQTNNTMRNSFHKILLFLLANITHKI